MATEEASSHITTGGGSGEPVGGESASERAEKKVRYVG
jgi:hypothetical protein